MTRTTALLAALALLLFAGAQNARASEQGGGIDALLRQDMRLAALADRMLVANSALCRRRMPVTGLVLHTRDQYGRGAETEFANGPVAVALVVPGSPAARAGLRRADGIATIAGRPTDEVEATEDGPRRDAVFEALAGLPATAPLDLGTVRQGASRAVTVQPRAGCRVLVEILAENDSVARSDGRVIQISYGLAAEVSDEGLAVILAHELAHAVLEHRRRLSEAGISKGLLAEVGRNQQANRQAEVEADRLSVHLLANTGFDPHIAPRFWLSEDGEKADSGLFRSFIYPSATSRAELMEREIDQYLPLGSGPSYPGHLLSRREGGI